MSRIPEGGVPQVDGLGDRYEVETPEAVSFTYELAGLGSRGLAAMLDAAILLLVLVAEALLVVLVLYLAGSFSLDAVMGLGPWALAALVVVAFLTAWGYFIGGEIWGRGRTVGKRALGVRVVRDDGSRIGPVEALIRNVVRIVDLLPAAYAIGIASILLSPQNKRLGDYAAGTVVVREGGEDVLPASFREVTERARLASEYLARRERLTPGARRQVASALLDAFGEVADPSAPEDVLAARLAELAASEGALPGDHGAGPGEATEGPSRVGGRG